MVLYNVLFGLGAALCWGSADIFATIVSRRLGVSTTLFFSHTWSLVVIIACLAIVWQPLALTPQLLLQSFPLGFCVGLLVACGYFAFYRGLELGPLAIVSPLTSADGAIAALLAILFFHEVPGLWQGGALLILFLGIIFVSLEATSLTSFTKTIRLSSLATGGTLWGLIAMLTFGVGLFGISIATKSVGWFLPIFWMRVTSALTMTCVRLWQQHKAHSRTTQHKKKHHDTWRTGLGLAGMVGILDCSGLLLYSYDTSIGSTGLAAAIGSCFVLLPLLFGTFVLRERLAIHQMLGVGLVVTGLFLISISH